MAKRQLGYIPPQQNSPKLIMLSVSAFGRTGRWRTKVRFDLIAQAFSGLIHMTGEPDGPPQFVSMAIADVNAGVHGFAALGYALFHRERSGRGQYIDISMIDALYHIQANVELCANAKTGSPIPLRGASSGRWLPMGCSRASKAGLPSLPGIYNEPGLPRAMGQPQLSDDPRFADVRSRPAFPRAGDTGGSLDGAAAERPGDSGCTGRTACTLRASPVGSGCHQAPLLHCAGNGAQVCPIQSLREASRLPAFRSKFRAAGLPVLWTSAQGQDNAGAESRAPDIPMPEVQGARGARCYSTPDRCNRPGPTLTAGRVVGLLSDQRPGG
ncbi:MAG: CoA transferase [Gammaproteobacteria bacterium]|nr:CoA transferase [Gammaproteobacteria bacterium]